MVILKPIKIGRRFTRQEQIEHGPERKKAFAHNTKRTKSKMKEYSFLYNISIRKDIPLYDNINNIYTYTRTPEGVSNKKTIKGNLESKNSRFCLYGYEIENRNGRFWTSCIATGCKTVFPVRVLPNAPSGFKRCFKHMSALQKKQWHQERPKLKKAVQNQKDYENRKRAEFKNRIIPKTDITTLPPWLREAFGLA